jgi:hypothetical protein
MQFHFGYNIVSIVPWLTQTDQNGLTRSELVKSVGLYINDEVFVDAFCGDFFADPFDMGENKEGAEAVYEQYMRDLSALRQVKKQTTVVVTLDPYCTKLYLNSGMVEERFDIIFWNRSLVNTLKLILPAIQWLKASGLDIRVHVLDDIHSTYEFTPTTENFSIDTYHKERMLVSSERSLYDWISGRFSILRLTS